MTHPPLITPSRRIVMAGMAAGLSAGRATAAHRTVRSFPPGFLWGSATSGHQTEGNNTSSDMWLLEHLEPTIFDDPSNDACNSLELWPADLALVSELGLGAYRFSLEWARIEPERGQFSTAMLDHYRRIIDRVPRAGAHTDRDLQPFYDAPLVRGSGRLDQQGRPRTVRPLL